MMKMRPLYISLALFGTYSIMLFITGLVEFKAVKMFSLWFAGFLSFTLTEYLTHRFLFHMEATNQNQSNVQYAIHGNHHKQPHEPTAIMIRPILAIIAIVLTTAMFYALFRKNILGLLPGFLLGYSFYLFIHYAIHAFRPPKSFWRILWRQHNLHHFHDDTRNFGVSSPLWDIVFKTYLPGKQKDKM